MTPDKIVPFVLIIVLTVVSGLGDAQGFIHAANIWQNGRLALDSLAKSALGFAFGISMYWLALRWMREVGVVSPEVQTLAWFGVTIVGVALASGNFVRWQLAEQVVAVGVLLGIGWLMLRTGA
jgi:hypothetical protein